MEWVRFYVSRLSIDFQSSWSFGLFLLVSKDLKINVLIGHRSCRSLASGPVQMSNFSCAERNPSVKYVERSPFESVLSDMSNLSRPMN